MTGKTCAFWPKTRGAQAGIMARLNVAFGQGCLFSKPLLREGSAGAL
ncbi:MAG: hypothetical protein AAGE80_16220 [Pseudomonadota bacterium]